MLKPHAVELAWLRAQAGVKVEGENKWLAILKNASYAKEGIDE